MENGSPFAFIVRCWYIIYTFIAKISSNSSLWQTKIGRFGEIANWVRYVQRNIDPNPKIFSNKDQLRQAAIDDIRLNGKEIIVLELGVAYGKGSMWLTKQLGSSLHLFFGFDRFTGLPRKWRGLNIGHFQTNGKPPASNDIRHNWYVGDAEETVPRFLIERKELVAPNREYGLFILFDMDILEPTMTAYRFLKPHLRSGDYIHFDEAFDSENEMIVLNEFVNDFKSHLYGITSEAITFKIL